MSAPVKTATTSSRASAALVSMLTIVAWASGERTTTACSIPGRVMSST